MCVYKIEKKPLPNGIAFSDEQMVVKIATEYSDTRSQVNQLLHSLFRKSSVIAESDIKKNFFGYTEIIGTILSAEVILGYLQEVSQESESPTDRYYTKGSKFT